MEKIIETKDLITFEADFPKLAIGNKLYAVNDLKETADKIDEVFADEKLKQSEKEVKLIKLALGEEAFKEIDIKKMNITSYRNFVQLIMATIQGMTLKEFQEQLESKN